MKTVLVTVALAPVRLLIPPVRLLLWWLVFLLVFGCIVSLADGDLKKAALALVGACAAHALRRFLRTIR